MAYKINFYKEALKISATFFSDNSIAQLDLEKINKILVQKRFKNYKQLVSFLTASVEENAHKQVLNDFFHFFVLQTYKKLKTKNIIFHIKVFRNNPYWIRNKQNDKYDLDKEKLFHYWRFLDFIKDYPKSNTYIVNLLTYLK
ncbi:hypothetical protein V2E24_00110 [Mycoplasmopsis ciconiae]|uniref:Uncharacterized protein n=1 Tax=Mycoplasmopsis ciconiae TaxID=561067 RepID=A0ABU7MKL0_9BACT|nr:hypothetical protein [Mycoplasmopsis ciconiae]